MKHFFKSLIPERYSDDLARLYYNLTYRYRFKSIHGTALNMKDPTSYHDKIFYRKINGNYKNMARIADKYQVRDYVREIIGNNYLVPILGVYEKLEISDFEDLPKSFVVKTNHGSGENHVSIVKNKETENISELVRKFNHSVTVDFGNRQGEDFYKLIEKKIIIEEYLGDVNSVPKDYKIHCFGGEKVFIVVDEGRFSDHRRSVFDSDWNLLSMRINNFPMVKDRSRPKNLRLMIELAIKLSEPFDYIRVDFYNIDGRIFFGELTQTPGNGFSTLTPKKYADLWASLWKLDKTNKQLYLK